MAIGNAKHERRGALGFGTVLAGAALLALVGGFLIPGGAASFPLQGANLSATSNDATLRIESAGAGAMQHEVFYLADPDRVVVDIFGADAPVEVTASESGLVRNVRTSIWKDDPSGRIVRYVLETSDACEYWTDNSDSRLIVHLRRASENPADLPQIAPIGTGGSSDAAVDVGEANVAEAMPESGDSRTAAASESGPAGEPHRSTKWAETVPVPEDMEFSSDFQSSVRNDSPDELFARAIEAYAGDELTAPEDPDAVMSMETSGASMGQAGTGEDQAPILAGVDPRDQPYAPAPGMEPTSATMAWMMQTPPMSLDVQDADLRTVFRSIAEFAGVNIVPDRDVLGPVSVRLRDVPWRHALDIVCQSAGLISLDGDGVIRVATVKTYNDERLEKESSARKREEIMPLQTHVFIAGYASAFELIEPVSIVLSDRGTVNADTRTNSVIVTDISTRIAEVAKLMQTLDAETTQVEITARLVDIDATANRQLGITWFADNLTNTDEGASGSLSVTEGLPNSSGQVRFGLVRDWGNLDATLEALEQSNTANIISNPRITTVNNHPARILVGKEIPLITLDERGNPVTELKKVGITLRVTPFINKDNRITMDLHPEISDLSSQATVQGGLIFTTTEAETRIMVNDGQTAVIGGLVRTNETVFEQGVPVLGSIPILGNLFKQSDTITEKRELLIFVTPRVVGDVASADG